MKKLSRFLGVGILVMASLCTVSGTTYAANAPKNAINLVINEVPITKGTLPILVGNRTLAPIRVISESLGAKVDYVPQTQKITITKAGTKIEMTVGKPQVKINGVTQILETVPVVKNGSTMLPLRFIGEALNCDVRWDAKTKTVYVVSKDEASGEKPVDKSKDFLGRKIRTTNLPKNAQLFPYVVEGIPNWVYEAVRINKATPEWEVEDRYNTDKTPKELWAEDKLNIPYWAENLEDDLNMRLNIDYRTVNEKEFADLMYELYAPSTCKWDLRVAAKSATDFYKQYKVISKAEVQVLPETFWQGAYGDYRVNAYVKLTVVQQPNKSTGKMYDEFGAMVNPNNIKSVRPVENKVYEGLVQMEVQGDSNSPHHMIAFNYNTSDAVCQINEQNMLKGAKPANQPSVDLSKQFK